MKNKNFNIILILIAPIVAISCTFLAMNFKSELCSILSFSSFAAIVLGLILSIRYKRKILSIIGILSFIVSIVIHLSDVSTDLFLGEEIAYDYMAEAPGFTEVKLYKNGKATVGYGGIFGVTDIFYLDYYLEEHTVILLTKDSSISFMNHSIEIDNLEYDLELKTKS